MDLRNDLRAKTFDSRTDMHQYSYTFLAGSCTTDVIAGMELETQKDASGKNHQTPLYKGVNVVMIVG